MAIVKVADRATVNGNAAVTIVDFVLTGLTVGNTLIIRTAADNSGSSGAARTITVTNQTGTAINVATDLAFQQNCDPGAASAGVTLNVIIAEITATSGTVRITYSGSVRQAAVAEEWSGINTIASAVVGTPVGANGTASTNLASTTDASIEVGNMAYAAVAIEGPAGDTYTNDSDSVGGTWTALTKAGLTNATATDNVTIAGAYKLPSAAGAQTHNPTNSVARDSAGLIIELSPLASAVNKDIDLRWNVAIGAYIDAWADAFDTADTTSHTANLPTHAVGDRLIVIVAFDTDGDPETASSFTDFTHGASIAGGAGTAFQRLEWKHRTVTGSEAWFGSGSTTFTTTYSTQTACRVFCVKMSDPGTAIATATAVTTGSSANVGNLDPSWDIEDTLWLLAVAYADKTTVSSTPAGYTSHGLLQSAGATNTAASLITLHKASNATSEDPAAVVLAASVNWCGLLLGIREVQTIVSKDVELLWDVEVITPVGKTVDVRWDVIRNVGRLAQFRDRHNGLYRWSQGQLQADNPATSWNGEYQYAAWVNPTRHYMIAKRLHGSDFGSEPVDLFNQTPTVFNAVAELDEHNFMSIGVDTDGHIHLAGGMHGGGGGPDDVLRYMRSENPHDVTTWVVPGGGTGSMVGSSETSATYPTFINLADGTLLFFYRTGQSGSGDWLINEYDTATETWSRVGTVWLAGISDGVSAYPTISIDRRQGVLGRIHSFWTWREDVGGPESNRYICYGYSDDGGVTWKKSDDTTYTLPITEATSEQLFDYPPSDTGVILNNPATGYNQAGDPQCVVLIETATPNLREYHHIHFNGTTWADINTGILGGGRPPIVKFADGTLWTLLRTTDDGLLGGVAAYDLTTPGTPSTRMLWSGDSLAAEWTVDTRALELRDEVHVIVGPTRGAGAIAGDTLDLGQYPGTAILVADQTDNAVIPILHRHGPATFQAKTTATTWQITPAVTAAVDEYIVVTVAHDPATLTGITDSKSNTYTSAIDNTNATGSHLRVWYTKVATAFTASDTITFTWSTSTNDKACVVDVYSGVSRTSPIVGTGTATGTSTTPSASRAVTAEGNLVVGAVATEGPVEDVYTVAPDDDTAWSVVARNGTTGGVADSNTTVARQYNFIDGPVTRSFAPTLGTSRDWSAVVVELAFDTGVTTLVVADASHGHTADNIVLAQTHILVVADASHAHTADNLVLTQTHVLTVADGVHAHVADNITLTQVHQLVVNDARSTHTADNVVLTSATILVVADGIHTHTADNLTLTQVHNLTVNDAHSTHTADNVTLTQVHVLTVGDAVHNHTADGPLTLTQVHQLVVNDAVHTHRADNVTLGFGSISPVIIGLRTSDTADPKRTTDTVDIARHTITVDRERVTAS